MPSPSDSSSVASMSGSRALSGSRRGMSGRTSARLLLYLGLCHLALGAMVLAFSFTSLAFTSSPRVRQSCPFWAGFFVVASGVVGVISWRRPFTLVVSLFMLLSAVCVILSLAGSMLSCQNAQMVKSYVTCQMENRLCLCCDPKQTCSPTEDETLVLYQHSDCHAVRHQLKDLLFSACGLSILSTIICTLSTVTCSIHIFSLDLLHLLAPHRSRSVNPECTTPQDAFLSNMMDFEEFVPPIPPPPYYPPEYTCSSETDAQSVTYNGSMESPVPLYPTDCPPPYEAVMGQRAPSQATVFDTQAGELSGERGTSTNFSGEVSMDSGSLLMSEIVDIPDDSSPSEDSCLMEVGVGMRARPRGDSEGGEEGEYASFRSAQHPEGMVVAPSGRHCFRGERSNSCSSPSTYNTSTYRSPLLKRQALLASSCSQLEFLAGSQHSFIPEIRVRPCPPSRRDSSSAFSNPPTTALSGPAQDRTDHTPGPLLLRPCLREQIGRDRKDSDGFLPLVRSHSEPGLSSSTDTGDFSLSGRSKGVSEGGSQTSSETGVSSGAGLLPRSSLVLPASLPRKGSIKAVSSRLPSKQVPATSLRLPKDCARSLGDLKVTRVLVQRFLQRSKRNLAPATEHAGNCTQGPKRRTGGEGNLPLEQPTGGSSSTSTTIAVDTTTPIATVVTTPVAMMMTL
ncbi:protein FAM189B isoform X3 [Megalobrama amblycephala]|uniref:protein FAM189B isoform X3 n=1 Tax=Megalobrama amblycephala TaxID=75352 RepID=UPI0020145EEA|nr:protein FAM189B isoform X3 [Megalobrama amblycephala]